MGPHQGFHLGPSVEHVVFTQLQEVEHRLDVVELLDDDQLLGLEVEVLVSPLLHLFKEILVRYLESCQGALGEALVLLLRSLAMDVVDPIKDPELPGLQALLDHDQRWLHTELFQLAHLREADAVLDLPPDFVPWHLCGYVTEGPVGELLLHLGPVLVPEHGEELQQGVPGLALEILVVALKHLAETLGEVRNQLSALVMVPDDAADPLAGAVLHHDLEAAYLGVEGDLGVVDDLLHLLEALFIVGPLLEVPLSDTATR